MADQSNLKRIRQAAKCLQCRKRRQARRLLDAYQAYLRESQSPYNSQNLHDNLYDDSSIHSLHQNRANPSTHRFIFITCL